MPSVRQSACNAAASEEGEEPNAGFLTMSVSDVMTLTLRGEPVDDLSSAHSRGLVGGHGVLALDL